MVQVATHLPQPSAWDSHSMRSLASEVRTAREEGKYLFIWDKNGSSDTYFKYQGTLFEWSDLYKNYVREGKKDKTPLLEGVRKALIDTMRVGTKLMIDFEDQIPNLKSEL